MKKLRRLRKGLAMLLSVAMVLGLMPGVGIQKVAAEESGCPSHQDSDLSYREVGDGTHYLECWAIDERICGWKSSSVPCTFGDFGACIYCGWSCNHSSKEADGKCSLCGYYEVTDRETAVSLIKKALLNRDAKLRVNLTGAIVAAQSVSDISNILNGLYNDAITHTPNGNSALGDYIAKTIETCRNDCTYSSGSSGLISIKTCYSFTYYTTSEQEQNVTTDLSSIYTSLELSELSEQEKVYKIYNWIVNNVSYDYENLNNESNKTKYTAYGALYDKKAVCQGFSALFYRMCLDNGIDCRIVTGTADSGDHAWNIVKVGEKYYYADPTWDCFVIEDTANGRRAKPGTFFYFLRGTLANHTESEVENVTNAYTMANAEEYLSAFKADFADGTATAVHLDGTALSDAEKTWYAITTAGETCSQTVMVKPNVSNNDDLSAQVLFEKTVSEHNYDSNGFCTGCSGYQPAELTIDKYDINGDNTKDEVYEISNAGQLYWFAGLVNGTLTDGTAKNTAAKAVLTEDIVVNGGLAGKNGLLDSLIYDSNGNVTNGNSFRSWTPIGDNNNQYTGTFDGNGYTVSGLYFNNSNARYVGLFGHVGSGGSVSNVGIVDSYINGFESVGGVCGRNYGTITNCYNTGTVSGLTKVGGVCGENDNYGTITNCYNTGAVSGTGDYVGGVCGYLYSGYIINCYYDKDKCNVEGMTNDNGTMDVTGQAEGKSTEQFKSGEVAYLLNECKSEENVVWRQNLGETGADATPVLDSSHGIVYASHPCESEFANTEITEENKHTVTISEDGTFHTCSVCKKTEQHADVATFTVDDENHSITAICPSGCELGTITLSASDATYDGTDKVASTSGTIKGFTTPNIAYEKMAENGSFETIESTPKDAGTYRASITYTVDAEKGKVYTVSTEYTIARRPVTITANDASMTYGGSDPELSYTVFGTTPLVNGEQLNGTLSRAEGDNAGTYKITQGTVTNDNNPNYDITFKEGTFTIIKAKTDRTANCEMVLQYDKNSGSYTATIKKVDMAEYSFDGNNWSTETC